MDPGNHLKRGLRLYSTSSSDEGSNSGGYRTNYSSHTSPLLSKAAAIALTTVGIDKLLQTFQEEDMRADIALRELSSNLDLNPKCKKPSCKACLFNGIPPVRHIETSSGVIYKLATKIPVNTKYIVYLFQCMITGLMYIGMTKREGNIRLTEHLRSIFKKKGLTLAEHFNSFGCADQFDFKDYMRISPLAYVSMETMSAYASDPNLCTRIMEYIEAQLIQLVGREKLLNRVTPCTSFLKFESQPDTDQLYTKTGGEILVDRRPCLIRVDNELITPLQEL